MFGLGSDRTDVICVACGTGITREEAREYDKHGDRWQRRDKEFEYLCKPCYREQCHQPRAGLEALLVESEAGECSREEFLARYAALVRERHGTPDEQR
jgi:hypothetical protein